MILDIFLLQFSTSKLYINCIDDFVIQVCWLILEYFMKYFSMTILFIDYSSHVKKSSTFSYVLNSGQACWKFVSIFLFLSYNKTEANAVQSWNLVFYYGKSEFKDRPYLRQYNQFQDRISSWRYARTFRLSLQTHHYFKLSIRIKTPLPILALFCLEQTTD